MGVSPSTTSHSDRVLKRFPSHTQRGTTVLRVCLTLSIGFMGIGIPQRNTPAQNWIVQAYEQGLIPAPAYSLILGRDRSGSGFTDGSLLVIGGYDTDLLEGAIVSFPLHGASHFQIAMSAVIINGETITRADGKPMQAIIDVSCIHTSIN